MPKAKSNNEKPVVRQVTRKLISNVTLALQSMAILPGDLDPPFWIDGLGPFTANEMLPMRNGAVHLPSVVVGDMVDPSKFVLPATPRFFSTYSLDFDFSIDAGEPVELMKFLRSIWPNDQESIECLQEWIGYLLTPETKQQKIAMLIGPKRSGRGTIARLIHSLVGAENVAGPRLSALATNFGLEPLVGKPVAIIGDARLSGRTDTGAIVESILAISGEDTLTIDRKHKSPWTGKLPTRLMLLSNELPRLPDQSGALAGRFLIWKFTESFYGREDMKLEGRLNAELPAILLWAIEGWKRLQKRGHFLQPASGRDLVEQLLNISSPVGEFVRECCETGAGFQVDIGDLFREWCLWCEPKRRASGDESTFGRNLRTVVPTLETKQRRTTDGAGVRCFEGVRLKPWVGSVPVT
jgi:putative DNA primase/helicase